MGIYDRFKTDRDAEVNGVELDFGDGVVLRVARASHTNPKFKKIATEVMGNDLTMNLKKGDSEELFSKMRLVYAKSIVLGWEGVTDEKGNVHSQSKAILKALAQQHGYCSSDAWV